jgi:hypothetical protein
MVTACTSRCSNESLTYAYSVLCDCRSVHRSYFYHTAVFQGRCCGTVCGMQQRTSLYPYHPQNAIEGKYIVANTKNGKCE